jgi:hypothetical protein
MIPNVLGPGKSAAPIADLSWRQHARLLAVVFVVKGLFLWMLIAGGNEELRIGRWAGAESDTWEYTDMLEPLIAGGDYTRDHRMPGLGAVYVPLRMVFDKPTTMDVIVVLQWLLGAAACYAVALSVRTISRSHRLFMWTLAPLVLCSFPDMLNALVLTEGFCTASLSFTWYFLVRYFHQGRAWALVWAGLFLTWAVFLRPIYAAFVPVTALVLVAAQYRQPRTAIVRAFLFLLPFLLFDGAWTWRNHRVHGTVAPLTNGLYDSTFRRLPYYALQRFVTAYGGDHVFWRPGSDLRWFRSDDPSDRFHSGPTNDAPPPPDRVLTAMCTRDSLELLAREVRLLYGPTLKGPEREVALDALFERTERFREAFAREKPFQYHVMARLRLFGHMAFTTGTEGLFSLPFGELPWWKKGFKLAQIALYWLLWVPGFVGAFVLLWRSRREPALLQLGIMVVLGFLLHPFVVRLCEQRYLVPTFQLTIASAMIFLWWIGLHRIARGPRQTGDDPARSS